MKTCVHCTKPIIQRPYDKPWHFGARMYCSVFCKRMVRSQRNRMKYQAIKREYRQRMARIGVKL